MTILFVQQLLALTRSARTLGCAYGQESPGWISLFEVVTFFLLKIYRNVICFGKIDWSMNSGRQWAGDHWGYIKKKIVSKLDKNGNKGGSIYKVRTLL